VVVLTPSFIRSPAGFSAVGVGDVSCISKSAVVAQLSLSLLSRVIVKPANDKVTSYSLYDHIKVTLIPKHIKQGAFYNVKTYTIIMSADICFNINSRVHVILNYN
jgi:hypothetical protein